MSAGQTRNADGPHVEAVLFDTFGTVVGWRTGVAQAVDAFSRRHELGLDATAFATRWRELYQPAMECVRNGDRDFVALDVRHAENLRLVLREHGVESTHFGVDELRWLNEAWHRLPPWPDVVGGLRRLARAVMNRPDVERQPRVAGPAEQARRIAVGRDGRL